MQVFCLQNVGGLEEHNMSMSNEADRVTQKEIHYVLILKL